MAGIPCARAGVSCFPFIGPFISIYNAWDIKQEMSDHAIAGPLEEMRWSLIDLRGSLFRLCWGSGESRGSPSLNLNQ
jgi:hypothetical protein